MKKLNLFSRMCRPRVGAQSSDVIVTSYASADEQPMSIRLASDGTSWRHAGSLLRVCAVLAVLLSIGVGNVWGTTTYTLIKSNSSLSNGDKVVIVMSSTTPTNGTSTGVTGQSGSDATVSTTEANWIQYTVGSASASGWTLYDGSASKYIASPSKNQFVYGASGGTCSVNSDGVLTCNSRYLCKNSSYYRMYTGIGTYSPFYVWKVSAGTSPTLTVSGGATSLAMGDAKVNGSGVTNSTLTFSGANLTANASLAISGTNASMFTVSPTSVDKGSGTITNQSFTVTYTPTSAGEHTATLTISSTGATSKTITLTGTGKYEVIWKNNGGDYTTTLVASGARPTFPDNPTSCDTGEGASNTFYGWSTGTWSGKLDDISDKTIYTSAGSMPTVAANGTTYHAVFCKGSAATWDKVTSAPSDWSGEYVITNSGGANAMISDFDSGTSGEFKSATVTLNAASTQITSTPTDKMIWIVEKNGNNDQYSFKNKSTGTYAQITGTSSTNAALNASAQWFTIASSATSGVWKVNSVSYSARCFAWYSSNSTFRTYANSTNNTGNLYKKSGGATSKYMTNCCTELGSIGGSLSWSSVNSSSSTATLSWTNNSNANSYSVTCTASSASAGSVGSITGTTTKSCAVTGLTPGTEYTLTITATGKSGYCDASQEIVAKAPKITAGSISGISSYVVGSGPGSIQTFTVSGAGLTGNLTVTAPTNFLVSTDNGSSWSASGGSKTITVSTPPSNLASTTIKVRLAAGLSENSYGPSDITISGGNAASVTVAVSGTVSPACSAPTIDTHPAGATYRVNVTATALSVKATKNGTGPDLTYQWYSNTSDDNTSGELIDGATNSSYTPLTSSPGKVYYYCEVSSGACMTPSNCAAITVSTPTITVSETSRAFGNKAKDSSSTMTFTVSGSNLGANIGLAISGTNSAMFSIDKTSLTHSSGTVLAQTITVTYTPTAVGSHTAQIDITSTSATPKTVSLSGTGAWTVEWYVGGTDSDNKLTSGSQSTLATNGSNVSTLTFPTSSQTTIDCSDKTFVGWTNTSSYTHGTSPLFTQSTATGTITSAAKYYAVFAEDGGDDLELVTDVSQLHVGDVVTIASFKGNESSGSVIKAYNSANNWPQTSAETDGSGKIDGNTTDMQTFTLKAGKTDGTWAFYDGTGYPYAASSSNNYMKRETTLSANSSFAITIDGSSSAATVTAQGSNTRNIIRYNSGNSLFSCYASGQDDIYLYRKPDATGHTIACESCDEVTMSISSVSNGTMTVKRNGKALANGDGIPTCSEQTLTVRVTPDAANHYWLSAMSISGVTGVTTDPSTTSGLPSKEVKEYSVTIPKDATGTLSITPTIEAIPQKKITFLVNGDDAEDNSPQDVYVGEKPDLPTAPDDDALSCAEVFVGWSISELTETGHTEPADLFVTSAATPTVIDDDVIYNAVFASEDDSKSGKYTLDYSVETSLQSETLGYGNATDYTATDESSWTVKAHKNAGLQINNGKDCSIKIPDCPSGATITTIEITGSAIAVGLSASNYSGSGTITYIATGTDASSQILDLRGKEVTGGYIVPKGGTNVITKIVVNYAKYKDYMTYCTKVFTDAAAADHNWNTSGNWSGGLPTIKDRILLQKPITVNVTDAKAREIILDQSASGKEGTLNIGAGKVLIVAETIKKKNSSGELVHTDEGDINIDSDKDYGLGALIMSTHDGTNQATVNFYSKSHGSKGSSASVNQFVGTPYNDETNILYNWYNSWVYEFTNTSGTASWKRITDGDGMTPFHGYCVISADKSDGHTYWQQGTLVASEDQNLTLKYFNDEETENMFANSWMAPIKISEMNGHMTNTTGTIYIFNSGSAKDGDGSKTDGTAGNYSTYTPGTAGSNVIPAMQAFTVYATAAGSLSLDYSAYVYDPAVAGTRPVANKAPQRVGTAEDEMEHLKLRVACENGWGDALDIYIREDFSEGFEMYYDGPKIEGDEQAPMLYAVTDDGKMAINCVPDAEGTVVGFRRGEDAYYQFTFDYEGDEILYLNDLKEQISTPISMDRSYTFTSAAGDMQARFIISRTPIHNTPTGVEDNSQRSKVESRKLLIDNHVFIIRNGQMYDVTGIRVRESNK